MPARSGGGISLETDRPIFWRPDVVHRYWRTGYPPTGPSIKRVSAKIHAFVAEGLIEKPVKVEDVLEMSFVENAVSELGPFNRRDKRGRPS
jgi:hypothetical protein